MTRPAHRRRAIGSVLALAMLSLVPALPARAAVSKVKILDASATEGQNGVFTVRLKPRSENRVVVKFVTEAGTAGADDYTAVSGKVAFKPGQRMKTISVPTAADTGDEPDEAFSVRLVKAKGAKIADGLATGTILDDDPPPIAAGALVINEVDYDQTINPDSGEFVEILNVTSAAIDLTNADLVFTGSTTETLRVPLSGTLAPGAFLVAGNSAVVPTPAFIFANNSMINATAGVMILDTSTCGQIDAVSYEGSVTAATVTGCGGTFNLVEGTPTGANDSGTGSLVRYPDGTDTGNASADWGVASLVTPGAGNFPPV